MVSREGSKVGNDIIEYIAMDIRFKRCLFRKRRVMVYFFDEYYRTAKRVLMELVNYRDFVDDIVDKKNRVAIVYKVDRDEFVVYVKKNKVFFAYRLILTKYGFEISSYGKVSKYVVREVLKNEYDY